MQRISDSETNCAIQWIVIYPLDSITHLLNNWGLLSFVLSFTLVNEIILVWDGLYMVM